jgi:hypothetical protein
MQSRRTIKSTLCRPSSRPSAIVEKSHEINAVPMYRMNFQKNACIFTRFLEKCQSVRNDENLCAMGLLPAACRIPYLVAERLGELDGSCGIISMLVTAAMGKRKADKSDGRCLECRLGAPEEDRERTL